MARVSRQIVEAAYLKVYGQPGQKRLSKHDDKIIGRALDDIRKWQGYFPGEVDSTTVSETREMDKLAASGDPTVLVRYFKTLGLALPGEADWELVFRLHKEYVKNDPTGQNHPITERITQPEAPATERDDHDEEENASEITMAVSAQEVDSNKNPILKEETKMATVTDLMGNDLEAKSAEAARLASELTGGAGAMNLAGTNVGAAVVTDTMKEAADAIMKNEREARKQWSENNAVSIIVLPSDPVYKKIPENVTEGKIKDANSQLQKILDTVWGTEAPEGMVDGMVDGQVVVPPCVTETRDSDNYTKVITLLNSAKANPELTTPIKKSSKFGSPKGVIMKGDNKPRKWSELKADIADNGMAVLKIDGVSGSQIQIKTATYKQLAKKASDKIKSVADLVFLTIPGRDNLIDMKNGVILDPNHVRVVKTADQSAQAVEDPSKTVSSEVSFSYMKKAKVTDKNSKDRKYVKRLTLICPQYPVRNPESNDPVSAFISTGGIAQSQTIYDSEAAEKEINSLVTAAFQFKVASADRTAQLGMFEKQKSDERAANAAEAADLV